MHVIAVKAGEPGFDMVWNVIIIGLLLISGVLIWLLIAIQKREKTKQLTRRGFEVKPITDTTSVPETKEEQA